MEIKNRVSVKEASKRLGLPEQTLRVFIRNGRFKEFAEATKINDSKHWTYYINRARLENYLKLENEPNQVI
ncbi:helix-turn-helix domain-containing protein [Fusobacterium polymorphum]|uniref:Helix-turn-helix domain-containing protein n=1 Tax=Fusobacterium nucleatum subsp. polymorphum TaxID=76857 RepID=A0A2C6ASE6_FUSNP|nr:helix-turn-helix domain-containing protein [Fusobacterium polymorphum]PHI05049.1 hypothetical protein CA845_08620 [Fusobacterium polymorphum]PHI14418.1 hypothetical protein CBG59_12580 [Fusobacterium polymorphum]